jgi:hypothetical protein
MAEGSDKQSELNFSANGSLQDNQPLEAPGAPGITVTAGQNESRLNVFRYIAGLKEKEQDNGVSVCDVAPTLVSPSGGSAGQGSISGGSTWIGNPPMDPRISLGAGLNMAGPNGIDPMMFAFQEQLRQTQSMCLQQQNSLEKLTAAITSLTNQQNNDNKSEYDEISSDENLSESGRDSDVASRSEPMKKKFKQASHSDRKLAKLKAVESSFAKQEQCGPSAHDVIASTVKNGLSSTVEHKAPEVQELLDKYKRPENCEYLQVPKVNKTRYVCKTCMPPISSQLVM